MAYYRELSKGNWQFRFKYVDNTGKTREKTQSGFKTKRAARLVAEPLETEFKQNPASSYSEKEFIDYYKDWVRIYKTGKVSHATQLQYNTAIRMVEVFFKKHKMVHINKDKYQEFINWYSIGKSKETVRKMANLVGGCFRHAFHTGIMPYNVTYKIHIPGNDPTPEEEKYLHEHELDKLTSEICKDLKDLSSYMILFQSSTGLRIGELMGLTFDSFDFENKTLRINKAWDYKFTHNFTDTKNGVHRTIDLDDDTIYFIKPFYDRQRKMALTSKIKNVHNLVFIDRLMSPITVEAVVKALKRACKRAGVREIRTHGLRHTHASILLLHGVDIQVVAKRLGDSVEVIQNTYAHLLQELEDKNKDLVLQASRSSLQKVRKEAEKKEKGNKKGRTPGKPLQQ